VRPDDDSWIITTEVTLVPEEGDQFGPMRVQVMTDAKRNRAG
jgi:hypothetical protein